MRLLSAGRGLPVKGISSTTWETNLPLPLEAAVQSWCPHLGSVLTSRGHTRNIEGEGWRGDSQKMTQVLENKLYEVSCREASH